MCVTGKHSDVYLPAAVAAKVRPFFLSSFIAPIGIDMSTAVHTGPSTKLIGIISTYLYTLKTITEAAK